MSEKIDRRKFINSTIRGTILSGIGIMTGMFLLREKKPTQESCDLDFVCQNCTKNKGCKLPQAFIYRRKNEIQ